MSTCGERTAKGTPCQRAAVEGGPCAFHREHNPARNGRPSKYTPEVAADICDRLALGESLTRICRDDQMPSEAAVRLWAEQNREGFSARYARARLDQIEHWADEIIEIADDGRNDTYLDERGKQRTNWDELGRSRLRIDTRKWLLSRLRPDRYGDRAQLEVAGPGGGPVEQALDLSTLDDEELATLEQLLRRAGPAAK